MKTAHSFLRLPSLFVVALAFAGAPLVAQEQETEREFDFPLLGEESSPQKEMERLFHEVERTMMSIDVELADAGAGEIPLGEGRESGIDRLLQSAKKKGDEASSGIDRILELAEKMGGSCSSCMKPGDKPGSGESPLDQERERGPQQNERTPNAPETSKSEQPQPKPGESPEDSPTPDKPGGENRPGAPREDEAAVGVVRTEDAERWGMLPERVQQVFQNQLTDDLPLQYRDWIDSYYRRLNAGR